MTSRPSNTARPLRFREGGGRTGGERVGGVALLLASQSELIVYQAVIEATVITEAGEAFCVDGKKLAGAELTECLT